MGQPLNKVQKDIYAEYLEDRGSTLYNIPLFEELLEGIDIVRLGIGHKESGLGTPWVVIQIPCG